MNGSRNARRSTVALFLSVAFVLVTSCVPPSDPTPPPPAPTAILTPNPVVAGNFVNVAPPTDTCIRDGSWVNFQAVMTTRRGVVVTQAYNYYYQGPSFSPTAPSDQFVRLFVPPFVAAGQYLVYLSCNNYLQSYSFSGATLTVSPGLV
jgi:hypothetical protein